MAEESSVKLEVNINGKQISKVIARNVSDSVGRRMAEERGFHIHKPERVIGKIEDMRYDTDGINFKCLCVPSGAPRHSGRYPWKDDDNDIREVFNMDSNRLNRFVSMINAAGGNFRYDTAIGEETMATIQIPASMLYHLHIDGDGSVNGHSKKIPGINEIKTFNDRAVQITFADGTQTKCVCGKDETFDLYEGIAFCLFKRFLDKERGHKHFNDLMRYAFKKLDEQEKQKVKLQKLEEFTKRQAEKARKQREKRKAKKREEQIGVYQEAMKRDREAMAMTYDVPNPCYFGPGPGEPEPPAEPVKKIDDGSELFFEPLSGRTFTSRQGDVMIAVMTLNTRILEHNWVSVNEWYEELGLDSTGELGESMGWNIDHMLNIDFASDITCDGRECLTIIYDNRPVGYGEGKA